MFFFRANKPAQRAAGGCSPLKATPGRGAAAGGIFCVFKIINMQIQRFSYTK